MQSLIECGVSPAEPIVDGIGPGHFIFQKVSSFHWLGSVKRSVLEQELIATCLEYLDSGGILGVFEPTTTGESHALPVYLRGYIVKRGLDIISQIISQGEFYG